MNITLELIKKLLDAQDAYLKAIQEWDGTDQGWRYSEVCETRGRLMALREVCKMFTEDIEND